MSARELLNAHRRETERAYWLGFVSGIVYMVSAALLVGAFVWAVTR